MTHFFTACRGGFKVAVFLLLVIVLAPVAVIYKRLGPRRAYTIPMLFHRLFLRLVGVRLNIQGSATEKTPVMFVANHASSLDIPILGSLVAASFVSKAEVADYPLFGFLARVQNTLFIEKRSVRAADQRSQLMEHVKSGRSLIMFPEGDSTDGLTVLPFKSSLFSLVEDAKGSLAVQSISIACTALNGRPLSPQDRHDIFVWHGDTSLMRHLWAVFAYGRFTIDVVFHPALELRPDMDRKKLAALCHEKIAAGLANALSRAAA